MAQAAKSESLGLRGVERHDKAPDVSLGMARPGVSSLPAGHGLTLSLCPRPGAELFMTWLSTLVIAFAMSTDAFAAAVSKGASLTRPKFSEALRTGAIFGFIEALTPLIGWGLGSVAAPYVQAWDHWIAFIVLGVLGLRMIRNGWKGEEEGETPPRTRHSFWLLAATGFATSIDAMAVGVTLAFIDSNILITAIAIGTATLLMVTLGVMVGRMLGAVLGRRAEILGGIALVSIGSLILYEHL